MKFTSSFTSPQKASYLSELESSLLNDDIYKSSTLAPLTPTLKNLDGRVNNTDIFVNILTAK